MQRWICPGILFSLFLIALHSSFAEDNGLELKTINVFQLPSIEQTIVAERGGYFPILNILNDRMLAIFRTGGGHIGIGGALSASFSEILGSNVHGASWTAPQTIVDGTADDRNPAVGVLPDQRIVLAYHEQASYTEEGKYDPSLDRARCMITYSDDQGKTWAPSKPLGIEGLESCSPYGRIVVLPDGTLLMNVYGRFSPKVPALKNRSALEGDYAYLVCSKDRGETWGNASVIMAQHNETTLLRMSDGRLLAVGRSSSAMQRLDASFSSDGGKTWTSPLRITGSMQHPGDLVLLSNGWILLLYGDRNSNEKTIQGVITRDLGRTWDFSYRIVASRPVRGDFGYPSAALLPNGNVAILYYSAGAAQSAYDGSKANAFLVQFRESELIEAYTNLLENR